jgi:dTDP-glucose 4,6-dehydratase
VRDWIYVEDNCRTVQLILEKGEKGQVYNIAGRSEKNNIEIAIEILLGVWLPETMTQFVGDRPAHDFR